MNLETPISIDLIKQWLADAAYDVTTDNDGDLYVNGSTSDFPYWVCVVAKTELVVISTYIQTKSNSTAAQLGLVCNTCNDQLTLPNFYYAADANSKLYVHGSYAMSYSGGLDRHQFLKMARRFASEFVYGLRTFDPDDVTGGDSEATAVSPKEPSLV